MIKKISLILTCMIMALALHAQNATSILDKSAATLRAAGNAKIGFALQGDDGSADGYIKLQGKKFVLNVGGSIIWFNGKTMWTYVKANEEVNVTNPTADQIAKMNPYAFLSFYKKGYTAKMGRSTAKEHEVILTGKKGSLYKSAVVRVNKSTNMPSVITMTPQKGSATTIRLTSIAKKQNYTASTFQFNHKYYPNAEIVDLR